MGDQLGAKNGAERPSYGNQRLDWADKATKSSQQINNSVIVMAFIYDIMLWAFITCNSNKTHYYY